MSRKEIRRYAIIMQLINKKLNGRVAAELLNLSVRHLRRLKRRVKEQGATGLVHASRGKPSNRTIPLQEKRKIIKLLHQHYTDFKPGLATEKLSLRHHIVHDPKTIRQIMIKEGLWKPKSKKTDPHRSWRQRRTCFGEMIQFDGSYEHWLEDRGKTGEICLLAAIDDATGIVLKAKFTSDEGVLSVFDFWKEYLPSYGKPYSIYTDQFSTYKMTQQIALENHDTKTQFQRVLQELNIEPLTAYSSQAKGRIERLFNTLQDRLIKELRLAKISTVTQANEFVTKIFLPAFNKKFSVEPRSNINLHRQLNHQEKKKLDVIFSRQYQRTVHNDWTISFNKQWYQLVKGQSVTICKKDIITIEQRLDNSLHFRLRGKYLNYELLPQRPQKQNKNTPWVLAAGQKSTPKPKNKPAPDHPWRRSFIYSNKLTPTVQIGHF